MRCRVVERARGKVASMLWGWLASWARLQEKGRWWQGSKGKRSRGSAMEEASLIAETEVESDWLVLGMGKVVAMAEGVA
jgi:hypothetical protein